MPLESVLSIPVNTVQVKSLVENNNYLDVDVDRLSQSICSRSGNSIDTTAMGKMRAALYRFYSRVKMGDGKYVCDFRKTLRSYFKQSERNEHLDRTVESEW